MSDNSINPWGAKLVAKPVTLNDPSSSTASIAYDQGVTGYATDGTTTRQYTAYAYKTALGVKVFSTPGLDLGTFTDDNSTVSFPNDSSAVSSSEQAGITGYTLGDTVDYLVYNYCTVNGVALFTLNGAAGPTVTITNATAGADLSWTQASFPTGGNPASFNTRILRSLNSGGYIDYVDVADPATSFQDDNTLWASGSVVTPTTVQNYYQINLGFSASSGTVPDGYLILRSVSGGGADATDFGNTITPVDTGTLPWSDPTTVTPISTPGTSVEINGSSGALKINNSYTLPPLDGTNGQAPVTNGSGALSFVTVFTNVGSLLTTPTSSNGAAFSGSTLIMQVADETYPGLVSNNSQTFSGDKTFQGYVATPALHVLELAGGADTMGVATLSSGAITVSTTAVTASSRIFLTVQALGTVAVPTMIAASNVIPGTSFDIVSADATDTSIISWLLIEPV